MRAAMTSHRSYQRTRERNASYEEHLEHTMV